MAAFGNLESHYNLRGTIQRKLMSNDQCSPSYRNQSVDLYCKSIDWFLYDEEDWSLMG